jgi:hypothetical protein
MCWCRSSSNRSCRPAGWQHSITFPEGGSTPASRWGGSPRSSPLPELPSLVGPPHSRRAWRPSGLARARTRWSTTAPTTGYRGRRSGPNRSTATSESSSVVHLGSEHRRLRAAPAGRGAGVPRRPTPAGRRPAPAGCRRPPGGRRTTSTERRPAPLVMARGYFMAAEPVPAMTGVRSTDRVQATPSSRNCAGGGLVRP